MALNICGDTMSFIVVKPLEQRPSNIVEIVIHFICSINNNLN